jgi:hypothetical protein
MTIRTVLLAWLAVLTIVRLDSHAHAGDRWVLVNTTHYAPCPATNTEMLRGLPTDPISEFDCQIRADALAAAVASGEAAYVITDDGAECVALGCNHSSMIAVPFGREAEPPVAWPGASMRYVLRRGTIPVCTRLSACHGRGDAFRDALGRCRCMCDDRYGGAHCHAALDHGSVSAITFRFAFSAPVSRSEENHQALEACATQAFCEAQLRNRPHCASVDATTSSHTDDVVSVRVVGEDTRTMEHVADNTTARALASATAVACMTAPIAGSVTTVTITPDVFNLGSSLFRDTWTGNLEIEYGSDTTTGFTARVVVPNASVSSDPSAPTATVTFILELESGESTNTSCTLWTRAARNPRGACAKETFCSTPEVDGLSVVRVSVALPPDGALQGTAPGCDLGEPQISAEASSVTSFASAFRVPSQIETADLGYVILLLCLLFEACVAVVCFCKTTVERARLCPWLFYTNARVRIANFASTQALAFTGTAWILALCALAIRGFTISQEQKLHVLLAYESFSCETAQDHSMPQLIAHRVVVWGSSSECLPTLGRGTTSSRLPYGSATCDPAADTATLRHLGDSKVCVDAGTFPLNTCLPRRLVDPTEPDSASFWTLTCVPYNDVAGHLYRALEPSSYFDHDFRKTPIPVVGTPMNDFAHPRHSGGQTIGHLAQVRVVAHEGTELVQAVAQAIEGSENATTVTDSVSVDGEAPLNTQGYVGGDRHEGLRFSGPWPSSSEGLQWPLRLEGVLGTNFDLGASNVDFTLAFWIRVNRASRGIVFAAVDDWISTGESANPVVERLVRTVYDRDDEIPDTWPTAAVYHAIAVDGRDRTLHFVHSDKEELQSPSRWPRSFTWYADGTNLADVFDGAWHHVAFATSTRGGQRSIHAFVDAHTSYRDTAYKRCMSNGAFFRSERHQRRDSIGYRLFILGQIRPRRGSA